MPTIVFVDHLGNRHIAHGQEGRSVMQVALDNAVPGILGDCGGACSCATCHVYIGEPWAAALPEKLPTETFMLEAVPDERPHSRLGCQIKLRVELDGMVVELPEEQV